MNTWGWKKSTRSSCNSECVEVEAQDAVRVRDSKDRRGPVLTFSREAWHRFISAIKNNEFE